MAYVLNEVPRQVPVTRAADRDAPPGRLAANLMANHQNTTTTLLANAQQHKSGVLIAYDSPRARNVFSQHARVAHQEAADRLPHRFSPVPIIAMVCFSRLLMFCSLRN